MPSPRLLLGLLLGCACARPPVTPPPTDARPAAEVAPHEEPAPPAEPPPPACRVDPLPAAAAPPPAGACVPVPAALQKRLSPELTRAFSPTVPGAAVIARYECDPLAAPVELVHETGAGHGHLLALTRLRWRGGALDALRIRGNPEITVERAELPAAALDRLLPELRALALARLEEKKPPDPKGMSSYGTSRDWFGLLRLVDRDGRALERGFAGYDNSDTQARQIPVAAIDKRLGPLLAAIPWQPAPVDDDARAFFVDRFLAASEEHATWWVQEHLVELAADAGTPALVPALIALAQRDAAEPSAERTREHALAALAVLAGFDARKDPQGAPVPPAEAAATYARACAPAG